jgi:hypothetical protein
VQPRVRRIAARGYADEVAHVAEAFDPGGGVNDRVDPALREDPAGADLELLAHREVLDALLPGEVVWPRWIGGLAVAAAAAYALRVGTLFTTDGPFAADGILGLWVPVAAVAAWIAIASVVLTLRLR